MLLLLLLYHASCCYAMILLLLLYHAFPVEPPHELHELVVMCYSIALTDCENLFSSKQLLNALVYLHPMR